MDESAVIREIALDLHALGIQPGEVLLVHSSYRSLELPRGMGEAVIRGFLEALGTGGTLLLPALSFDGVDAEHPDFDLARTPSCVGYLPEFFRSRAGTCRSVQPTHSVCGVGPGAAFMTGGHHLDWTPCGPNSPYRRLAAAGGRILMLGCGLRPNTSMHGVEELVEPPYLFAGEAEYRIHRPGQPAVTMTVRRHDFHGYAQRYDRVAPLLEAAGGRGLVRGRVRGADCHLIDAATMWREAEAALRRDPFHFVEAE